MGLVSIENAVGKLEGKIEQLILDHGKRFDEIHVDITKLYELNREELRKLDRTSTTLEAHITNHPNNGAKTIFSSLLTGFGAGIGAMVMVFKKLRGGG